MSIWIMLGIELLKNLPTILKGVSVLGKATKAARAERKAARSSRRFRR